MSYLPATFVPLGFFALIAFGIATCDPTAENIRACSHACDDDERQMDRYNHTDGCVCKDKR